MRNEYPNPMVTYNALEYAYDIFNKALFRGELRPCLISVHRRRSCCGFFWPAHFESHDKRDLADEIGLDPRYWGPVRSDAENLSTLVHEMCHLWQHHSGKPGHYGYHNREFARKMFEVGLIASDTGEPGGKATGPRVGHYIKVGGPFDCVCSELLTNGFVIPYHDIISPQGGNREEIERRRSSRAASKTTYACPKCPNVRAWGKPGLRLACRQCDLDLKIDE